MPSDTPAARAARADRERTSAGWSWETNAKRRTKMIAATLALYGTTCHLCRKPGADSADHLQPRSRGGTNELGNLRPSHRVCNSARGDLPLAEWFAAHPVPRRPAAAPSRDW